MKDSNLLNKGGNSMHEQCQTYGRVWTGLNCSSLEKNSQSLLRPATYPDMAIMPKRNNHVCKWHPVESRGIRLAIHASGALHIQYSESVVNSKGRCGW